MKLSWILVIVLMLVGLVAPAFAQTIEPTAEPTVEVTPTVTPEPTPSPGLPSTAVEGLNMLAVALAALAGLAGNRLTEAIKRLPFLTDEEKSKLSGLTADLVAFVLSTGVAYLITYLTPAAQMLDQSGLWQVLVWSWPAAKVWFETQQRRKAIA